MHAETVVEREAEVVSEEQVEITEPNFWRVIMHNDNVTTMDFVVALLVQVFHKTPEEAMHIMLLIHNQNSAIVGRYTHEIAEDKKELSIRTARAHDFPLMVTIEEETE